ncbi:amidohydrolase family protein [Urbifossiella limnaea]|uniref:Amidohydrolase n=1 Tax=Urbifossiella limnaea TaxID=2528023 RepID=A0A517XMY7_9BACT|nr:amidohydrolase family protein [Urbifossiella limnaea]QDU18867.1 Amidohydrolase [Urbifossiella limnaea]
MIVDTNLAVGPYPFRHLPLAEPAAMAKFLKEKGVTRAWAGSTDALLHRDVRGVNDRLAATCQAHGGGILVPFGTVNPKQPGWEDDLKRCADVHKMPGLRLHPDYHNYTLADPALPPLLEAASAKKLVVVIVGRMEEERVQHPVFHVTPAAFAPLPGVLAALPDLKVVMANWRLDPSSDGFGVYARVPNLFFDIAMIEGLGRTARLVERVGAGRVLFGSHAPVFVWESAALKLREAALRDEDAAKVRAGNATALVP